MIKKLENNISDVLKENVSLDKPGIEGPDFAMNIAMRLAKKLKKNPMIIAEEIKEKINGNEYINKIEIVKPGFINIFVKDEFYREVLREVNEMYHDYGKGERKGEKINVEFVSANPTGPLVVVSGRSASVGDSMVRILNFAGYDAFAEYYVNDAGNQIEKFALSLFAYYKHHYKGEELVLPEDGYGGEFVENIMKELVKKYELKNKNDDEIINTFKEKGPEIVMEKNKRVLDIFRVRFDRFQSEKEIREKGIIEDVIKKLNNKGKLKEKDGALWFEGKDKEWVIKKSKDGDYTYIVPDVSYHVDKYNRGYDRIIDLLGPDHHGHIERMKEMLESIGLDIGKFEYIIIQLVTLLKDGKKLEMSKRKGVYVSLEEFLLSLSQMMGNDEIVSEAVNAARYFFVRRKNSSHLNFDMNLAVSNNDENPVYYVQYAHARIKSLFRRGGYDFASFNMSTDNMQFTDDERKILRHIAYFPVIIENISKTYSVHDIPFYLEELAGLYHSYYYNNRILDADEKDRDKRLFISKAVGIVISNGLSLIGVNPVERM